MDTHSDDNRAPTLKELYPHLTADELIEAKANLERYLLLVLEIYEGIERDPVRSEQLRVELERRRGRP